MGSAAAGLQQAGTGKSGFTGHGGPAKEATLSGPKGISIDSAGNVWLADCESHSIRMVNMKTGNLELIAGLNQKGDGPDGDPLGCKMARPHGVFCDADGTVWSNPVRPYIRDLDRYRVVDHRICMYCFSPDERFIAGTLGRGRVAYASGCSGQMFKFGAVMGEKLAAAVTGNLSGPALAAWARGDMPAMAV